MYIESVTNSHKIKYEILNNLFRDVILDQTIYVYINLDSILANLYRDDIMAETMNFKDRDRYLLSGNIINIVSHYRHYFWTRHKKRSQFFLYVTATEPSYSRKYLNYYSNNLMRRIDIEDEKYGVINKYIRDNLKIVSIVMMHSPYSYLIPNDSYDSGIIPQFLISNTNDRKVTHLVLTKEKTDYQLLNINSKDVKLLHLSYNKPSLYYKDTIFNLYFNRIKYRPNNIISPELYTTILSSVGGTKELYSICSFVKICKMLDMSISNNIIQNYYPTNIEYLYKNLFMSNTNICELINRFKSIDLKFQYKIIPNYRLDKILTLLIDVPDISELHRINLEFYKFNPIQYYSLFEGYE